MGDLVIDHGDPWCELCPLSDAGQRNLSRYRCAGWHIYWIFYLQKLDFLSTST